MRETEKQRNSALFRPGFVVVYEIVNLFIRQETDAGELLSPLRPRAFAGEGERPLLFREAVVHSLGGDEDSLDGKVFIQLDPVNASLDSGMPAEVMNLGKSPSACFSMNRPEEEWPDLGLSSAPGGFEFSIGAVATSLQRLPQDPFSAVERKRQVKEERDRELREMFLATGGWILSWC